LTRKQVQLASRMAMREVSRRYPQIK